MMIGKLKKSMGVVFLACLMVGWGGLTISMGQDDPRVKVLMQEGLKLYTERQYIKALDLFNQVLRLDPANVLAQQYIKSTEDRITEWDSGAVGEGVPGAGVTWDSLLDTRSSQGMGDASNAKDIIAARKSLVARMKSRSTNTDNIVKIEKNKRGMEVVLYHDQLFLPGLLTLRDEALPVLDKVAMLIRENPDKEVTIYSLAQHNSNDPFLLYPDFPFPAPDPTRAVKERKAPTFNFQDIEATRSFALFTHLAQMSMGRSLRTKK